ncbi:MAG: serine protease, partial [Nitrospirae bacterium]|nr:serine protease [Nitrospirota bacterium]
MKLMLPVLAVVALAGPAWWQATAPSSVDAAVPPVLAQGFSEIVKKVTPAVVNIAVTGNESRRGGRRQLPLPPGPFGGPPGEEPPGEEPGPPIPPPPGPPGRPEQSAGSGVIID